MAMNNYGYNPNQFYMQDLQNMRDRIDRQMMQIQQQPNQNQQPTPITQNFQLAPNNMSKTDLDGFYARNIDDVKNKLVFNDTIFVDNDFKMLWRKDVSGNIKTFALQEIIELDEKDKQILSLQKQIEEMKELIINGKSNNTNDDVSIANTKSTDVSSNKSSKK